MNVLYKASTMRDWLIKGGIYARKSMGEPCVVKKVQIMQVHSVSYMNYVYHSFFQKFQCNPTILALRINHATYIMFLL